MNFKTLYNRVVDFIFNNRRKIMKISFSFLAILLLFMIFYFSSNNFNINNEVNTLANYIEDRQYSIAQNYYDDLEKDFSSAKMNRFNEKLSKKLSLILMNNGDMYINNQITKEQYMGLINIVDSFKSINIDMTNMIDLGKRVDDMYKNENVDYDVAYSYLQITSTLKGIDEGLDEYKQHIKTLYESRNIYQEATKYQSIKKYHEAILSYDKVIKEDKKYYSLAQNAKKECIDLMYDYYINQAKSYANEGKYEEALTYLSYLTSYYNDEKIDKLEDEYNKYVSDYTMTSNDIINLIVRRSNENKNDITVTSYLQTINGKRYYYGEVIKEQKVINEVLIDTETKKLYSYKSNKKSYDCDYSDAYFKIDENTGSFVFSIDKDKAKSLLEEKFKEKQKNYNSIEVVNSKDFKAYNNKNLKSMIKTNGDIYYYFSVKIGWFRPKEMYIINMYNKAVYSVVNENIEPY